MEKKLIVKAVVDWLIRRGTEPSTYAGLGAFLGGIHLALSNDELTYLIGTLMAIVGFVGMVLKDKGYA